MGWAKAQRLGWLTNLEIINLSDTRVTDAGLIDLIGLAHLRLVYVRNSQVTEAGVAALKQAFPDLEVER